ncbi:hypothetical protein [Pseudomonas citronellolis]|uniref:hypothetical protein n=1 Tax=Pseudomonas citronellolis TaxID=53408 RepID=UPI0023E450E7|nr:hypothetical protein [Pseudomonas citronellolis]MDF3934673.1 hypothetical protein [Pseudomonas citronellolis]
MSPGPSPALLVSVLCQLSESQPRSLAELSGRRENNLLAIRELFRQGRITGVLRDDPFGNEDEHGPLLCDAERLRLRRPYACQVQELHEQTPLPGLLST